MRTSMKLLSLLLALCMALNLASFSALAEEEATEEAPAAETVEEATSDFEPVADPEPSKALVEESAGEQSIEEPTAEFTAELPEETGGDPEPEKPDADEPAEDDLRADGLGEYEYVSYDLYSWDGTKVTSQRTGAYAKYFFDNDIWGGTYYMDSRIIRERHMVSILADTTLVLLDGSSLTIGGLYVAEGCTLIICGSGELVVNALRGAAIGGTSDNHPGGSIEIHGATVVANGADHCAGIGGNDGDDSIGSFTMYAGTVTARGGSGGAGIGGGRNCDGGTITIYGGTVNAYGGSDGAAIGGGDNGDGGTITIYGGTVNANDQDCNENGAGIGGGDCGSGGDITIYGGTITAYSRDGAGIGGGDDGAGGNITIYGGNITSNKINQGQGARIGSGCDGAGGTVTISGGTITTNAGSGAGIGGGRRSKDGTVTITGGTINASGSNGIGSGDGGAGFTVTLGYTDATRDSISVTASTFNDSVTLTQPFYNENGLFPAGAQTDLAVLSVSALRAWDGEHITTWSQLQGWISETDNDTIVLTRDYTAAVDDAALRIVGRSITIDLNGHTLNRGWNWASNTPEDGEVLYVAPGASLTIRDSAGGGKITGGGGESDGGGIVNGGTLTLEGGAVTGNTSFGSGGGILNRENATLTIAGGEISDNTAAKNGGGILNEKNASVTVTGGKIIDNSAVEGGGGIMNYAKATLSVAGGEITGNDALSGNGGGIYNSGTLDLQGGFIKGNEAWGPVGEKGRGGGILQNGTMNISGAPVVTGNSVRPSAADNIHLLLGYPTMKVTGELTEGACLYVTAERGMAAITSGYGAQNGTAWPGAFFHSDSADYVIALVGKEAAFAAPFTVTLGEKAAEKLTVDKTAAAQGEIVAITVTDDEKAVTDVIVRRADLNGGTETVPVTPGEGKTGTITMPGADVTVGFDSSYCRGCWRFENSTTICRDCGERCILCDPGFNMETGRCSVCDAEPLDPGGPDDPGPFIPVEPEPIPITLPLVQISEDGTTATALNFEGLYARVALVIENSGVSGLYVTQAVINEDGRIVIPSFQVPGLTVTGVSVILTDSLEGLLSPAPDVAAMDFVRLTTEQ